MNFELNTNGLKDVFSAADIHLAREWFMRGAKWTNKFLPVDDVKVTFFGDQPVDSLCGLSASSPGPHNMSIFLHPNHFYLRDNDNGGQTRFMAVVAHELHHIKRWRGPGYGRTWGESMVSEGLALKFQRETEHPDFTDERSWPRSDLRRMAKNIKPFLDIMHFLSEERLYDADGKEIDHYPVGLALIEGWSKYTGLTATESHAVPAGAILQPWLDGKYDIDVSGFRPAQKSTVESHRLTR